MLLDLYSLPTQRQEPCAGTRLEPYAQARLDFYSLPTQYLEHYTGTRLDIYSFNSIFLSCLGLHSVLKSILHCKSIQLLFRFCRYLGCLGLHSERLELYAGTRLDLYSLPTQRLEPYAGTRLDLYGLSTQHLEPYAGARLDLYSLPTQRLEPYAGARLDLYSFNSPFLSCLGLQSALKSILDCKSIQLLISP